MSKRITLEKLAEMIADGFNETTGRLDVVTGRLDVVEEKIGSLENTVITEINRLDIRLDQMAPNFDVKNLNKRVTKIEKHLKLA